MTANTHLVKCPQHVCTGCGGQTVTATYKSRTVEVAACDSLIAQGWTGPSEVLWHSQALELEPADGPRIVRHVDGLVSFAV